jgi:HJR/Mrr/RecB family endonuclease
MTGKSRGFGFVEVPDAASADAAIRMFHNQIVEGRSLMVAEAKPGEERVGPDGRVRRSYGGDYWSSPINAALTEVIATLDVTPQIFEVSDAASAQLINFFARHPEEMKHMHPRLYEELIAEIWSGLGYDVELQKRTRDGGVDIIAIKNAEVRTRFLIQCKRLGPGRKVSVDPVRELLGVKYDLGASKAVIATTGHFTHPARQLLDAHRWELEGRDYDGVVEWLKQVTNRTQSTGYLSPPPSAAT